MKTACVRVVSVIKFRNRSIGVSKLSTSSAKQGPARDMWAPRKANNSDGKPFRSRDQTGNDFRRNYFMHGNLRLLASQFPLFQ